MKREKKEPEEAGCPLWVVTFGDAMSLLVTFFVMLVSFADFDEHSLQDAFGAMKGGLSAVPRPMAQAANRIDYSAEGEGSSEIAMLSADDALGDGGQGGDVMDNQSSDLYQYKSADYYIRMLENGVSLVINQQSVFESGTATLSSSSDEMWKLAASLMRVVDKEVRIDVVLPKGVYVQLEGYTKAWGLGVEQGIVARSHIAGLAERDPGQISTSVQVLDRMPQNTSYYGFVRITFIGSPQLLIREMPSKILQQKWNPISEDENG